MNDAVALQTAVALRRKIHRWPELGGREFRTTALVARTLRDGGVPFRRARPTGGVAWITEGRGPCVALRADMDALPLQEKNPSTFRSQTPA
ncbi:MAG: hypothetical protein IPO76_08000 [Elusimicrobia bacterium]|nr:hypothetical protein [Elusimicrobiota bacterium]